MTLGELPDSRCAELSAFLERRMGLHFPAARWPDLRRAIVGAAAEAGFAGDVSAFVTRILGGSGQRSTLAALAGHLTVGETYFFRDRRLFSALRSQVLPALLRARRGARQLRLWSAACATGEEAYSLAILVRQTLAAGCAWQVEILATDINPLFLERAREARYGEWSFRDVPAGIRECFFTRLPDGRYTPLPEIRETVRFAHVNLADENRGPPYGGREVFDVILCRNVLMYFRPARAAKVVARVAAALRRDGWLVVSPGDLTSAKGCALESVEIDGALLHRRCAPAAVAPAGHPDPGSSDTGVRGTAACGSPFMAAAGNGAVPRDAQRASAARVRTLADQGRFDEALACCDRWIAGDRLDTRAHYLRALVLIESGAAAEGRQALRRAVYLEPEFTLAHVALGELARAERRWRDAVRHFGNALGTLSRREADERVPEADGLKVGQLRATLTALCSGPATP
mgnify:CR=1 FL=1